VSKLSNYPPPSLSFKKKEKNLQRFRLGHNLLEFAKYPRLNLCKFFYKKMGILGIVIGFNGKN
jgi:hypothetical protein